MQPTKSKPNWKQKLLDSLQSIESDLVVRKNRLRQFAKQKSPSRGRVKLPQLNHLSEEQQPQLPRNDSEPADSEKPSP